MTTRPSPKQPDGRRRIPLVAILVGVVAVLLVGAIAVNALTKDDSSAAGGEVAQTRPVTIEGAGLDRFPGNGADDPAIGQPAPVVKGQDFSGAAQSIGGQTGTPTIVMFVAHWCPHCQREVPRVVGWRADGTIPDGIDLAAVSTAVDQPSGNYPPSEWLKTEQWPGRIIADDADSSTAAAYGLTGYPYFIALDGNGVVVARGSGELEQADMQALVSLLQGA